MGFVFRSKDNTHMTTQYRTDPETKWEVLAEIPFNSDRKRMSLLVRTEAGGILLMTKGADTIMTKLLAPSAVGVDALQSALDDYAREGLRTLVLAQRPIDTSEYEDWIETWNALQLLNTDDKDEQLDTHAKEIEHSLNLVGATAIEDKL
jgi:magnesium-transporting ATPase (P-type)